MEESGVELGEAKMLVEEVLSVVRGEDVVIKGVLELTMLLEGSSVEDWPLE